MSAALSTPAFVVDAESLRRNAAILGGVKARTGCKMLLALKAFSMPAAAPLMQDVLDGTCASSVHEARLGREVFGGETHAFAAAFSERDMRELLGLAAEPGRRRETLVRHITFNSFAQWRRFRPLLAESGAEVFCGLRVNPEHSERAVPLYDPCAPGSRLGIRRADFDGEDLAGLSGLHFHTLCEQDADAFERTLAAFEERFGDVLENVRWFNFGGGHHITRGGYDQDRLCRALDGFRARHPGAEIYLEPGEAWVLNAGTLVSTVLDVVRNDVEIAILDASCVCHMPDVIEMPYRPRVFRDPDWDGAPVPGPGADRGGAPGEKPCPVRLAGPSCLAGDVVGDYSFDAPLRPGDRLVFEDMALYTMVKTTTFNGIRLPSIFLREEGGALRPVRTFGYPDFLSRL
ncbi:MAG: carboxynorspermidine decarboxylase [Lentisphaerae bacterium]|nr:carboxynorspermidine decarboxylase [Lentisphaerota bacterium]